MFQLAPHIHIWLSLGIIVFAMGLYVSEVFNMTVTSLVILLTTVFVFWLFPLLNADGHNVLGASVLLAGFGNPALMTIMAFLVMAQGLFQSGALEGWSARLERHAERSPWLALGALLILIGIASAFLNNTPMVLMAIPILAAMAARTQLSDNRFMMSLSFISILGGMTTLIGSSTNLLVANAARIDYQMGFFTQSIPGLVLAAVGASYVIFVMPMLMPRVQPKSASADAPREQGRQYLLEMTLRQDDALIGAKPQAGFFQALNPLTLKMVQSGDERFFPPLDVKLKAGDTLLLAATRKQLEKLLSAPQHPLHRLAHFVPRDTADATNNTLIAEAVVAPGSRMSGRTIHQTGFTYETGCTIIGVQRQTRMAQRLLDHRLVPGDVLLVLGTSEAIARLRSNRDVLPMEWRTGTLPNFASAQRARLIFFFAIASAATGLMPVLLASLGGALAMLLGRVLNLRQAVRGLSMNIFLLIATALALASALERTGGAAWLSEMLIAQLTGLSVPMMLSVFFLICALCTNLLSNNATAVLFVPIALNLAHQLNAPPAPFLMAVIFAANCSFATPIAYQTNLLVMAPGNYRFVDFLRFGTPLVILLWLTYSLFAPWYYGL